MKCLKIKRGSLGFRIESAFTLKDLNGLMEHLYSAENLYQSPALAWRSTACRLSLACWPTSSAGFSRPIYLSTLKSLTFWWVSLRTPSAAEREGGRLRTCWFLRYQSANPSSVSPPSFSSDLVKLLLPKEYAMRLHQDRLLYFSFFMFVPLGD